MADQDIHPRIDTHAGSGMTGSGVAIGDVPVFGPGREGAVRAAVNDNPDGVD